jgi:hypothetical protein
MRPPLLRKHDAGVTGVSGWTRRALSGSPLTVPGTVLAAVSLGMLSGSVRSGNPYGYTLAAVLLGSLIVLCLGGAIQAGHSGNARIQWDSGGSVRAGPGPAGQRITVRGVRLLPFYRLHFRIAGPVTVGRGALLYVSGEASSYVTGKAPSSDGYELAVALSLPFCGELRARGRCRVRDIFGLTGVRLGRELERTILVQPGPFSGGRAPRLEADGGFEEDTRRKASEEERYYMREYLPGDRFRDINWKASSRLARLITRISPYTQEKTRLLQVELRHFRDDRPETVESLVHLNVLKSWLLFFLREAKRDNPHYHFLVETGRGAFLLETGEDIDRFSLELSRLFFQEETVVLSPGLQDPPEAWPDLSAGLRPDGRGGRVFIFSTPYDRGLHRRLGRDHAARARILTTIGGSHGRRDAGRGTTVRLFSSAGTMPVPGSWLFRRDRNLHGPIDEYPGVFPDERTPGEEYPVEAYPVEVRLW